MQSDGSKLKGVVSLSEEIVTTGGSSSPIDITTSVKEIQVIFASGGMTTISSKEFVPPQDATHTLSRLEQLETAFEVKPI